MLMTRQLSVLIVLALTTAALTGCGGAGMVMSNQPLQPIALSRPTTPYSELKNGLTPAQRIRLGELAQTKITHVMRQNGSYEVSFSESKVTISPDADRLGADPMTTKRILRQMGYLGDRVTIDPTQVRLTHAVTDGSRINLYLEIKSPSGSTKIELFGVPSQSVSSLMEAFEVIGFEIDYSGRSYRRDISQFVISAF